MCVLCLRIMSDGVRDQLLVTIQKTFNYSRSQAQQIYLMVMDCMKKRELVRPKIWFPLSGDASITPKRFHCVYTVFALLNCGQNNLLCVFKKAIFPQVSGHSSRSVLNGLFYSYMSQVGSAEKQGGRSEGEKACLLKAVTSCHSGCNRRNTHILTYVYFRDSSV